ncbi:MAG: hypothetical protein FWE35_27705 [Streptosporangiales bacterium]|nr:hypothetical protein [Streptosporangiales bacterium]
MGSMKVTVNLAMRARDVSRPRPEHLAEAAAREESVPARVRPAPPVSPPPPPRSSREDEADVTPARGARRRRRRSR